MLNIEYREYADEKLGDLIGLEFTKFAEKNDVKSNYIPFCFTAKDNDNFAGVITGHAYYKEIKISDLLILEQYRSKQIGRKLIETVENHFKEKGYTNINLSTYGFQAPDFYTKCGFHIEYIRKDANDPKLTKYFFIKYFDESRQKILYLKGEKIC